MDDFSGADISAAMGGGGEPAPASDAGLSTPSTATATEPTAQPGAATTQPAATPTTPPAKPAGPIPFDVHHKALENARAKEREEYDRQFGWAKGLNKADYDAAVAIAKRTQADPIGYVRDLIAELQQHPTHGPALRSEAARALASGRSAPTMPEPDVAITDEHGNVIGQTYSASQMAKRDAWLEDQFLTKVRQEMAPIVKSHHTNEAQRAQERADAEGKAFASGLMAEAKDLPHFQDKAVQIEIRSDIVRQIEAYDQAHPDQLALPEGERRSSQPEWLEAAFHRAYNRIVIPRLDASARKAIVGDLNTKAGNSGVTPGRPPVGAPRSNTTGRFTGADLAAEFNARKLG